MDIVDHADVMNFTADSRYLIYDALCSAQTTGGAQISSWTIFQLDIQTGQIRNLIGLNSDYDIANPSLGKAHNRLLTLDYISKSSGASTIVAFDTHAGSGHAVATNGVMGIPCYNGDDKRSFSRRWMRRLNPALPCTGRRSKPTESP